jgi:outer membrane usher protein
MFSLASGAQTNSFADVQYETSLPLYDKNVYLGEVFTSIRGEEIQWLEKSSLLPVLSSHLKPEVLTNLQSLPEKVTPTRIPFPVSFNPRELRLEASLPLEYRISESTNLREDYLAQNSRDALRPAPFGGAINYRLEQTWADERNGGNYFNGQFNSFLNLHRFVFENQTFYQSDLDSPWFRGDTRIVKDFEQHLIRTQIGDFFPEVQGFMQPYSMGGVNVHRNFALNPYRLPFPTGNQNFTLKSRSFVKYYVNGVLVKSEYLPAGNYTARDIPLNNGLNTITIEAIDELGLRQFFVFRTAASINLLNEGESRFDLSYGRPFLDTNLRRDYADDGEEVFSGFFQYGFTLQFSASGYLQHQKDFHLLGTEVIQATVLGNFNLGMAKSFLPQFDGEAFSLGYQFLSQGLRWFNSQSLGLRFENRSQDFRSSLIDQKAVVKNSYSINYTLPLISLMTLSLGGNYGEVRDNALHDRLGYDATINIRLFDHHNLSLFIGRTRDEFKNWNDVAYAFLTITLPESSNFVTTLYDHQQKSTKITALNDNQNRLYEPRTQMVAENSSQLQMGELDVNYPTPFAELGTRLRITRRFNQDEIDPFASLRLNSALVFAFQDGNWAAGASRPVPGSFVIFHPGESLKNQTIALKSTSPFNETQTGPFGEITFSNLLAYQYRDIQLDPSYLSEGSSLTQEKYTIYPTYRSAHFIQLESEGSVNLQGKILLNGQPAALQTGKIGDKIFFTNREGKFFIEGLKAGTHQLMLDEREETFSITINENERGLKNLGVIGLKE